MPQTICKLSLTLDVPLDAVGEMERFLINISNINLNSLNILSKLQPRSTKTLEGNIFISSDDL